jgi:hypothetical protein
MSAVAELRETQDNEVEALKAIYMDDYEDCGGSIKSAWNVSLFIVLGDMMADVYGWVRNKLVLVLKSR